MTYKKFYYHPSEQKGFATLDKEEIVDCMKIHENEYYIWDGSKARYIKCIYSGWQI